MVSKLCFKLRFQFPSWMLEAELEPPQKSKIESFATIVNGFEPLNVLAKLSILDVFQSPG